jgi:hypothetical protein
MMFLSLKSHTTGVTSGSGTVKPSGAPEFISVFMEMAAARCTISETAANFPTLKIY